MVKSSRTNKALVEIVLAACQASVVCFDVVLDCIILEGIFNILSPPDFTHIFYKILETPFNITESSTTPSW